MTIEEYIDAMLPMIKLLYKEKAENPDFKRSQLWYLYRQCFYGFAEFMEHSALYMVSQNAKNKFQELMPSENLKSQTWKNQPSFDRGRKIFNLDHVYTGDMFRKAVEKLLDENRLSTENVIQIIKENYKIAWILKTEERTLPKSKRGETLHDALKIYAEKGIQLE